MVDSVKLDEISWTIVAKRRSSCKQEKKLTDDELFVAWQAFNKINIDNDSVLIDIEEAVVFLEEFMKAMGTPWTKGPLDDFADGKIKLSFWELIKCLESKYINKAPKRFVIKIDFILKVKNEKRGDLIVLIKFLFIIIIVVIIY